MRALAVMVVASGLAACDGGTTPAATDAGPRDAPAEAAVDAGPLPVAGRRCAAPEPWATPIADYVAAGDRLTSGGAFLRGVQDLARWEGRLFVGYGDANINLGRATPIEFRAFTDPASPEATAEFRTDEEQLEQYRALDGELWMAGVDATEDAWLGNVYGRVGGRWTKHRTVPNGVHVHDIASWRGALWAVGSGATPTEWGAGDVYGHLWRSADRGATFAIAARHYNMRVGDARWTRMLPLRESLLVFGYRSNAQGRVSNLVNQRFDGTGTTPLETGDPLRAILVVETLPLPGGGGLVRGAITGTASLVHRAYRVDAEGRAAELPGLAGRQILDAWRDDETGEILLMSAEGDEWGGAPLQWAVRVEATRDLATFTEVASFVTDDATRAVARWGEALYFGRDDGAVLRCALE